MFDALFVRRPGGVARTARGVRFLPAARELLAVAEAAAGALTRVPLRVEVWGHLHPPHAVVQGFAPAHPGVIVQTSLRRNLPLALTPRPRPNPAKRSKDRGRSISRFDLNIADDTSSFKETPAAVHFRSTRRQG